MTYKIKEYVSLLTAALMLLMLTSCKAEPITAGEELSEPASEQPGMNTDTSKADIELTDKRPTDDLLGIAYYSGEGFDPLSAISSLNINLFPLVYEGLVKLDESLEPEPLLCERFSRNGNRFTVYLRKGVTFHDGSTLTATDVYECYMSILKNPASLYRDRLLMLADITVVDDYTVVFTLCEDNSNFRYLMNIPIVKYNEAYTATGGAVGCGRYQVVSDDEGFLYLSAFRRYHGGYVNNIELLEMISVDSIDALIESFDSNESDLYGGTPLFSDSITLRGNYDTKTFGRLTFNYVAFNTKKRYFATAEARRGFSMLLDKQSLVGASYGVSHTVADFIMPSFVFGAGRLSGSDYSYNTRGGMDLLYKNGFSAGEDGFEFNGNKLDLKLVINAESNIKSKVADGIIERFAEFGIKVVKIELAYGDYIEALEKGGFDLYIGEVNFSPDIDLSFLLESKTTYDSRMESIYKNNVMNTPALAGSVEGETQKTSKNYGSYSGEELDTLLADYRTKGRGSAADTERLIALIAEEAPIIPLCYENGVFISRKGEISNVEVTTFDIFSNIAEWELRTN